MNMPADIHLLIHLFTLDICTAADNALPEDTKKARDLWVYAASKKHALAKTALTNLDRMLANTSSASPKAVSGDTRLIPTRSTSDVIRHANAATLEDSSASGIDKLDKQKLIPKQQQDELESRAGGNCGRKCDSCMIL